GLSPVLLRKRFSGQSAFGVEIPRHAAPSLPAMIEGRKVSMSYPLAGGGAVRVIQEADFRIETGAIRALVGRSGTGKSTLLNLIGGLDRPTGGEILIDGRHLESMSDAELSRFRNATVG